VPHVGGFPLWPTCSCWTCGGYGALYGAFRSRVCVRSEKRPHWRNDVAFTAMSCADCCHPGDRGSSPRRSISRRESGPALARQPSRVGSDTGPTAAAGPRPHMSGTAPTAIDGTSIMRLLRAYWLRP